MGIKETIINNMKKIGNRNIELSDSTFDIIIEKAIENMYQKGVSLSNIDPIETLRKEIEPMGSFNLSDVKNIEMHKQVLKKLRTLDYIQRKKIEEKLSNSLDFEEYNSKDEER